MLQNLSEGPSCPKMFHNVIKYSKKFANVLFQEHQLSVLHVYRMLYHLPKIQNVLQNNSYKILWNFIKGSRMIQNAPECYGIFQNIQEHSRIIQNIIAFSRRFENFLECFRTLQNLLESSRTFQKYPQGSKVFQNPSFFKVSRLFQILPEGSRTF